MGGITMVKLTVQQDFVDRLKWATSMQYGRDMSGSMGCCKFCQYRDGEYCTIEHAERVEKSACAKAFNKMKKGGDVDWAVIANNEQKGVKDK